MAVAIADTAQDVREASRGRDAIRPATLQESAGKGTPAAATTTTVTVTPTPSRVGQAVTVAASVAVAAGGAPVGAQGSVIFREGTTVLAGPLPLDAGGAASFVRSDFAQGARFIEASYSGVAGSFAASTRQVLHFVDAATSNPSSGRFCNTSPITFPNAIGTGSPHPTRIQATGIAGVLSRVTLELNGLSHQTPDDLDLMLTGPNGNSLVAFSDVGGFNAVSALTLVLDSTAATALPNATLLTSGTFRPSDFEVGVDVFTAPAPTGNVFSASSTSLGTAFNGGSPAGTWTLWTQIDGAGAQGGGSLSNGWCINLTTTPPQLTISKTHSGNFVRGQVGATYTVTVGSAGPGSTAGPITVVDTPSAGLTVTGMAGTGWTCNVGTRTCTSNAVLAANGTLPPITVTVDVAANASSPQVNSVTVSGGGGLGATANDSTTIVAPDLTLAKSTQGGPFQQGGTVTFLLAVENTSANPAFGTTTVQDTLPTGLTAVSATGPGWTCTIAQPVACTRTTPIPGNSTSVITLVANIAATAPASITNTASVSNPADASIANNTGSTTFSVTPVSPDLTISKAAQGGGFAQGGTVTYLLAVNNIGNASTNGTITVEDTIPTGLAPISAAGTDWSCSIGQPVSCARAAPLAAGASSTITLAANIAANAPATISNTATVQVQGDANTGNNAGTSVISVAPVAPDLTITKSTSSSFLAGGTATYTLTVRNGGNAATAGAYTVNDNLPTGLVAGTPTGAGWNCAGSTATVVTCGNSTVLAPDATTTLTLPVTILSNAPRLVTNTATVSGGGETNTGNNSGSSTVELGLLSDGFEPRN